MVKASDLPPSIVNAEQIANAASIFERKQRQKLSDLASKSVIAEKIYMYIYFLIVNKYQSSNSNKQWMKEIENLDSLVTEKAKDLVEEIQAEINIYIVCYSDGLGAKIRSEILNNLAAHVKGLGKC